MSRWTAPQDRALTQLWRKGVAPEVIATSLRAQFGGRVSPAATRDRALQLGLVAIEGGPAPAPQPESVPPVPGIEPRPVDWPPAGGVELAVLRRGECRFPVSGFRDRTHLFCAEATTGDSPYCAAHRAKALQPPEPGRGPKRYPGWHVEEDAGR